MGKYQLDCYFVIYILAANYISELAALISGENGQIPTRLLFCNLYFGRECANYISELAALINGENGQIPTRLIICNLYFGRECANINCELAA
jgi:hypothetical protein